VLTFCSIYIMSLLLSVFGWILSCNLMVNCLNCPGCTPLDNVNFDKLISTFPASLIKFDVAYPYGDDHDQFAIVSKEAKYVNDLFIGEVGIKDYAEKDNEDLAKRFDVSKDQLPAVILFTNNAEGKTEHFKYSGPFKAENLKNFVRLKSGIYMPREGCLEQFDILAERLVNYEEKVDKEDIIKKAEEQLSLLDEGSKPRLRADIYVKVMKKVLNTGIEFIKKEEKRLKKLEGGKMTKEKKEEIKERQNILKSFSVLVASKEEL